MESARENENEIHCERLIERGERKARERGRARKESNHLSTFIEAGNETLKNKLQFSCYIRQMAWQRVKRSPLLSHAVQGWPLLASKIFFISPAPGYWLLATGVHLFP